MQFQRKRLYGTPHRTKPNCRHNRSHRLRNHWFHESETTRLCTEIHNGCRSGSSARLAQVSMADFTSTWTISFSFACENQGNCSEGGNELFCTRPKMSSIIAFRLGFKGCGHKRCVWPRVNKAEPWPEKDSSWLWPTNLCDRTGRRTDLFPKSSGESSR